jgi:mannose-6-phosphate isomerase-like protein (cupin superfamily)
MAEPAGESRSEPVVDMWARTLQSDHFRREILTSRHGQVVLMTIPAGGQIGEEVHPNVDQILVFTDGQGEAIMDGVTSPVREGVLAFVKAGTRHNFVNTGSGPLRLFTVYAPPEHPPGTVHRTKEEADAAEE